MRITRKLLSGVLAISLTIAGSFSANPAFSGDIETIHITRPGSSNGSFANTFITMMSSRCINAYAAITDEVSAMSHIIARLSGKSFCPDEHDMERLAMRCSNPDLEGKHPSRWEYMTREGNGQLMWKDQRRPTQRRVTFYEPGYVYYGFGDCWNVKYMGSSVRSFDCNNATFGGDPKPGVRKFCVYSPRGPSRAEDLDADEHFDYT